VRREGRKVGLLVGEGFDSKIAGELIAQIKKEGAKASLITSKIQGELDSQARLHAGDMALRASPSVLFDAVVILSGEKGDAKLASDPNAVGFLMDALRHCKAVGISGVAALSEKANLEEGPGVVDVLTGAKVKEFVSSARQGRFWEREKD
jgi:catalase